MTYLKQNLKWKCERCFKPVARRLALFSDKDEYECYAENYVKCFWNLCDQSPSVHTFIPKPQEKVITKQPLQNEIQLMTPIPTQKIVNKTN